MKLDKDIEDKLLSFVKEIFSGDEWDFNHTLACVRAMKKIVAVEGGDERVLVTVMYLHDVGYAGALKTGYSLDDRIEAKSHHMARGVEKAKQILSSLGFLAGEIDKICYLISVHDKLEELTAKEELFVLEADSLGQIDPLAVGSHFGKKEYERYVKIFERKRAPKFVTETGKKLLLEFAQKNELFQEYTKLFKKIN